MTRPCLRHQPAAVGPDRSGERGSALVLAMLVVTVVMVLTVGLLAFAEIGSRSSVSFQMERQRRYAVDGALQSGINMVRTHPNMGVTTNPDTCVMEYTVPGDPKTIYPGTYLVVECAATNPAAAGAPAESGGTDTDGGQRARDVTFTVSCDSGSPAYPTKPLRTLSCGSGGEREVLAKVRVRYEIDYSVTPASERAVVPKVISWELRL